MQDYVAQLESAMSSSIDASPGTLPSAFVNIVFAMQPRSVADILHDVCACPREQESLPPLLLADITVSAGQSARRRSEAGKE